jgi:hypothetical protein
MTVCERGTFDICVRRVVLCERTGVLIILIRGSINASFTLCLNPNLFTYSHRPAFKFTHLPALLPLPS